MIRNLTPQEELALVDQRKSLEAKLTAEDKADGFSFGEISLDRVAGAPDGFYGNTGFLIHDLKDLGLVENEGPMSSKDRAWFTYSNELFDRIEAENLSEEEEAALLAEHRKSNPFNDPERLEDYGVADTVEQVVEYYSRLNEDPRHFIVSISYVSKAEQPEHDGWRWHKWGEYIGTKEPQYEYLADEGPEFDTVVLFGLTELKAPQQG